MTMLSIGRCIGYWADRKPRAVAIHCDGRSIAWGEFERSTNRLARSYAAMGVGTGDTVTIALPNGIAFYEAAIAVWKLGATVHPISWRAPAAERDATAALVRSKLVVGSTPESAAGSTVVPDGFVADAHLSDDPLEDRVPPYWKALGSGGSTGRPKIIVSRFPGRFDPLQPPLEIPLGMPVLVAGPLYHNASFMGSMRALFCGSTLIVMPRFDAEQALAHIDEHRVGWVAMVPTMMSRIAQLPPHIRDRYALDSLRVLFHTGAACPAWLKQFWIDLLGPERVHEGYGGTEGCGGHWITGTEWLAHRGSVGRTQSEFEVRIYAPDGTILAPDQEGDIYSRPKAGPGSTYFYLGSEPVRNADGFEWIGDMGHLDADGYLYIADRRTDMIISGGVNMYPAEIEGAIDAFPGVRSSAVIGLPDDDMGWVVHAIVEADPALNVVALGAFLDARIARNKLPRSYEIIDEPLRDEAGKVRRGALRAARMGEAAS